MAQWRSGAVAQWRSGAVAQWRSGAVAQWRSGAVVQWLKGRASDSRLRGRGFESCAAVLKPWANVSLYIAPVHSAV